MDFLLNGSDTDWLVYADYLEDQGIDATHIREGVIESYQDHWYFESCNVESYMVGCVSSDHPYDNYHEVGGRGVGPQGNVGVTHYGLGQVGTSGAGVVTRNLIGGNDSDEINVYGGVGIGLTNDDFIRQLMALSEDSDGVNV